MCTINRLTRDEILIRALDMVDSATLDDHDRPSGTIVTTAFSIRWIQDALDLFYQAFPWEAPLTKGTLSIVTGSSSPTSLAVPAGFIHDVRNGIILTGTSPRKRLARKSFQEILALSTADQTAATPVYYTVIKSTIYMHPRADATYPADFWYNSQPAVLASGDIPTFPVDHILIEYVRIRGLEWIRAAQIGTAMQYARQEINLLRESGLGREPEANELINDPLMVRKFAGDNKLFVKKSEGAKA